MKSVLIVDDNAAVRMLLADFVNVIFPHLHVYLAEDGAEGIVMANRQRPDLILMDADMPAMNGYEAAELLKKEKITRHIPIVAISGAGQDNRMANNLRKVANASLPKPFTAAELMQTMQDLLHMEMPYV